MRPASSLRSVKQSAGFVVGRVAGAAALARTGANASRTAASQMAAVSSFTGSAEKELPDFIQCVTDAPSGPHYLENLWVTRPVGDRREDLPGVEAFNVGVPFPTNP